MTKEILNKKQPTLSMPFMIRFLVVYRDTWQIKLPTDHVPSRELLWLTCDFLLLKKTADSVGGGSYGEGCSKKKIKNMYV